MNWKSDNVSSDVKKEKINENNVFPTYKLFLSLKFELCIIIEIFVQH